MNEVETPSYSLDQLNKRAISQPETTMDDKEGPGAAAEPVNEEAQAVPGAWGIGVSQEVRPEGTSYKVRVCVRGEARYLGRWVGPVCQAMLILQYFACQTSLDITFNHLNIIYSCFDRVPKSMSFVTLQCINRGGPAAFISANRVLCIRLYT